MSIFSGVRGENIDRLAKVATADPGQAPGENDAGQCVRSGRLAHQPPPLVFLTGKQQAEGLGPVPPETHRARTCAQVKGSSLGVRRRELQTMLGHGRTGPRPRAVSAPR